MGKQGSRSFRISHSSAAFSGGSGIYGNTKINKFTKLKNQTLEEIVSDSYKEINVKLAERAKVTLKYFAPGLYQGLLIADFLYRNRGVIINTIQNVTEIWSDEQAPVSEKIFATAGEVLKNGAEIVKKELTKKAISYIASEFADEAVSIIEDKGISDTVGNEVLIKDQKERFEDLLKDTLKKQIANKLESMVGDEND